MTGADLVALAPVLVLGGAALVVLLLVAARRMLLPVFLATLAGGIGAFAALFLTSGTVRVTTLVVIDDAARFFIGLLLAGLVLVSLLSYRFIRAMKGNREEFYLLLILATLGAAVLTASAHFATLFLGMEILSVSLYGMLAYSADRPASTESGVKYLFAATLASAVLLFGMALLYAQTGSMSVDAAVAGDATRSGILYSVGMSMLLIGFALKLALAPFHMWVGDVYQGAPAPATAAVATLSKAAMLAIFYRYLVQMQVATDPVVAPVVLGIAIVSMLVGGWLSLMQRNVKRMLAYSSISQVGYLLIPLFAFTTQGKTALYYGLAAYFLASAGTFGVVTVLSTPDREADLYGDYRGLAARRPWLAGLFTLLLLSLAGIPLTMGFTGKLYLFVAAAGSSQWLLAAVLLAASALGLFYYLRLVLSFFETGKEPVPAVVPIPALAAVRITGLEAATFAVLTLVIVALGVWPAPFLGLIQSLIPV